MAPDRNSAFGFALTNLRWLAAGFLMALASSFGQTFFIALYAEPMRQTFGLSHGQFGGIYTLGTLASALTLIQLGRVADNVPARTLSVILCVCLALMCIAMALAPVWWLLPLVIFGLRLFGQGMLSHLWQVSMARWFVATRGWALALASFGHPTGEALMPLVAVALIATIGWRESWGVSAIVLIVVLAPALWLLLARERHPRHHQNDDAGSADVGAGMEQRHWTRSDALRHPLFWMLIPGILGPSFILTAVFFLPTHIAEVKGWDPATMPIRYWTYAATSVVSALGFGWAIDRFSARACLTAYQLPMMLALIILWWGSHVETASLVLILCGITTGGASTIHTAIWAELYGTRHIGAIKSLALAAMVFSTAAGPGIVGLFIDLGFDFPVQGLWMAVYSLAISGLFTWLYLAGPLGRVVKGTSEPPATPGTQGTNSSKQRQGRSA
jgi:MFS family permease